MTDVEEGNPGELASVLSGGLRELQDEETLKLHLQLLGSKPKRLPRWMNHYRTAAYIIYSIIACYSIFYLIFIGVHQANPRFQVQYSAIVRYLEYNSYSILSPLLCPLLMCMLMYHVKNRVKLDEGDFFGVLSVLLFLALVNIHDSWGILKIINWSREHQHSRNHLVPPAKDDTSRKDLHWQYAWSTRTVCARKYVRDLQYKYELSKKHIVRLIVFQNNNPVQRSAVVADPKEIQCNMYHNIKSKAKIRAWMKDIQNEFKCCGPYGYKAWQEWFDDKSKTGCSEKWMNKNKEIPSCYDPVMRWLEGIMVTTFWVMLVQGICYIVSMFMAGIHHSAMKYEEEKIEKRYSLLSMTDYSLDPEPGWWHLRRPPDKPVIIGEYPVKPKNEDGDDDAEGPTTSSNAIKGGNKMKSLDDSSDKSSRSGKKKKKVKSDHGIKL